LPAVACGSELFQDLHLSEVLLVLSFRFLAAFLALSGIAAIRYLFKADCQAQQGLLR